MSEISKKSPAAIGSTADRGIAGREILWHSTDFIYCEAYSQVSTYTNHNVATICIQSRDHN